MLPTKLCDGIIEANNSSQKEEISSNSKQSMSYLNISRSPITCPSSSCGKSIGMTSLLSHFVLDHLITKSVDFEDILKDQRSVLVFQDQSLKKDENICIGVLAYGGCNDNECSRPAVNGLSLPNAFLPPKHLSFINHLPILIMACRSSITAFIVDKEQVLFIYRIS